MRNEDRILTSSEAALVATRTRQLTGMVGKSVTLEYVKRDGTESTSTGIVESVTPKGSKGIVILDTRASKGRPTSVNLYNVTKVIA